MCFKRNHSNSSSWLVEFSKEVLFAQNTKQIKMCYLPFCGNGGNIADMGIIHESIQSKPHLNNHTLITSMVMVNIKQLLAFIIKPQTKYDWQLNGKKGQGVLNITGYSTDLLDCSVVARYNARTKSEGTVVRSPL